MENRAIFQLLKLLNYQDFCVEKLEHRYQEVSRFGGQKADEEVVKKAPLLSHHQDLDRHHVQAHPDHQEQELQRQQQRGQLGQRVQRQLTPVMPDTQTLRTSMTSASEAVR